MAFDGIVLNCVVNELNSEIIGAKVNKIFEPSRSDIIFGLYNHGKSYSFLINIQPEIARFHLTTYNKPNPLQAPNFCMLLRKHLMNAKIVAINTFDLERVIEIVFESYNELKDIVVKKIFVETMASHSNVILTNSQNTIIDALRHVSNNSLEIIPARQYKIPSNKKHSILKIKNGSEFLKYIPKEALVSFDKVLSENFIGISRSFCQNLLPNATTPVNILSDIEIINAFNLIKNIINNIPNLSLKLTKDKKDYMIFPCEKNALDVNFFLDNYYHNKEIENNFLNKKKQLLGIISSQLKKYLKRLENINLKLKECENIEKYRIYGELITANLFRYKPHLILNEIIVQNYYDNQKEICIPLDKRFSISKNAEKYFKKYNKLKNTLKVVTIQKRETEIELEYIQSILFSIENSSDIDDLEGISSEINESGLLNTKKNEKNKKSESQSFPIEFNIDGYTVLVGKNNKQNDFLTFKIANRQDIWFHVQNTQGCHVVLKSNGKPITEKIILKCANFAVQNSKAKNSTNVPVDYCPVKNVKKPSGSKPRHGNLSKLQNNNHKQ